MRYPHNLPQNGKIGFLAPSFGCATEPYKTAFENALRRLGEKGYQCELGANCFAGEGVGISNLPEKCAEEAMGMFASDADILISCGGGELMCEVLPYMDFEKLATLEPKWFMGYSDNTNFTFLLPTMADTASIYGPCAASFGMEPWHNSLQDAYGLLCGEKTSVKSYGKWESEGLKDEAHPLEPYNLTECLDMKRYLGDEKVGAEEVLTFSGRLIGGCMDCLVNLTGTKYDHVKEFNEKYIKDGFVWFLEACDLNVFGIRRAMWQMEQAGWFQNVKGVLVGRPANGEGFMGLDAYQAILAVAGKWKVPVIMDVDLGHRPPMMPVIVGSYVEVCSKNEELELEFRML